MQYLFTGMAMALIGGYLAYVFRMQLGFPDQYVPGFGIVTPGEIQCAGHHARQHHDFLGGHARADRRVREFSDPPDDRMRRHGVSTDQSPVVSDFSSERCGSSGFVFCQGRRIRRRLDFLSPAFRQRRLQLDPCGGDAVAGGGGAGIRGVFAGRHQLHRHDHEQPRSGHENVRYPDRGVDDRPGQHHVHGFRGTADRRRRHAVV